MAVGFKIEFVERINEILNTHKISILLSFVGITLIIGGVFSSGIAKKPTSKPLEFPSKSLVESPVLTQIKVDVSGAVNNPQVLRLSSDSRMEDAIKAAGGFSDQANANLIAKTLNLSAKVIDGQKIYIPLKGESVVLGVATVGSGLSAGSIGINSSSLDELDKLPGIGPVSAQKIVDGRPFSDPSDLVNKKIVSKATFMKIKDLIDLN